MYVNSNNEKINPKNLETTHIINAINKSQREIFNSQSMDDYNKYINNINILREELDKRIDLFVKENIDSWE